MGSPKKVHMFPYYNLKDFGSDFVISKIEKKNSQIFPHFVTIRSSPDDQKCLNVTPSLF